MRRKIVIALLALGTVGGFGAGFARMASWHHGEGGCHSRREAFEQHVADVCVGAARRALEEDRRSTQ